MFIIGLCHFWIIGKKDRTNFEKKLRDANIANVVIIECGVSAREDLVPFLWDLARDTAERKFVRKETRVWTESNVVYTQTDEHIITLPVKSGHVSNSDVKTSVSTGSGGSAAAATGSGGSAATASGSGGSAAATSVSAKFHVRIIAGARTEYKGAKPGVPTMTISHLSNNNLIDIWMVPYVHSV
jgi:hypothetical protein